MGNFPDGIHLMGIFPDGLFSVHRLMVPISNDLRNVGIFSETKIVSDQFVSHCH